MNNTTNGSFAEFVSFKSSKKVRMNNTTVPLLNEEVCDGGEDSISGPKADGKGQTVVVVCTAGSVFAEACSAEENAGKEG
jgi:hypothetical protein